MTILLRAIFLITICLSIASADVLPGGAGLMFNKDYMFEMRAPKGWTLDNEVSSPGVCAVFYPTNSSWKDSATVFYVNSKLRNGEIQSPENAVREDIREYHSQGSPKSKASKIKDLPLTGHRMAAIWQYTGDRWGNVELSALIVEQKGISVIVLTARNREKMQKNISAFEELILSYKYIGKTSDEGKRDWIKQEKARGEHGAN